MKDFEEVGISNEIWTRNAKTTRLKDDVIEEAENYGDYGFRFTQEQAQKVCGDTRFRLVQWHDLENDRWFEFLSNDFDLTAQQIADLYRKRWQIELFFKKLKQNLKIKSFIGTSENAVMTQIWTAAVATLLIEILRRIARYHWSFSRLLKFVRLNLLTYKKLDVWINRPDFRIQKQSPPKTQRQMELNFDWKWSWGPTFKGLFGKAHVYWEEAFPTRLCTFLIRTAVKITTTLLPNSVREYRLIVWSRTNC